MDTAVMDPPEVADADVPADPQMSDAPNEQAAQTTRPNSPPPPTAEEIAEAKRIHYEAIRDKEVIVRELESCHAGLAEQAKDAKKEFEAADKALRFLIARGYEIAKKWPVRVRAIVTLIAPKIEFGQEFDVLELDEYKGTVRLACDPDSGEFDWLPIGKEVEVVAWGERPIPTPVAEVAPDESWRDEPVTVLDLTAGVVAKLAEAGVETMGQLEDLRVAISENRGQWPKGVGPGSVSRITESALTWLNENREPSEDFIDEEFEESEGDEEGE